LTQAQEFYIEHKDRPFYGGLVDFMTSGDAVLMILQKDDGIKAWREFMGPTNSITVSLRVIAYALP
jgi:nucleoside-diphosphate kinase